MEKNLLQWKLDTIVGVLYIVASNKGLRSVSWSMNDVPMAKSLGEKNNTVKILQLSITQLNEYFLGKRKSFAIPFDTDGTAFQRRVWKQLSRIPYGQTRSYTEIADQLESRAVRAVGTANRRNPILIIVPCHRVISASGALSGYVGGLAVKKQLLELEQG